MKIFVFSALLLLALKLYSLPPSAKIDIKHYAFTLELNDTTDMIRGSATIRLSFTQPVTEFELDLMEKSSTGKGMTVTQVAGNDIPLKYSQKAGKLFITLAQQVTSGSEMTLTVIYSGVPDDGLIIGKNKYGDRTFFGDNWPDRAHHWLPVIDHPADKATVEFLVIAPPVYEVIANGVRMEESLLNPKQKLTHWREDVPLPTKVMVIGAARFAIQYAGEVGDIAIEQWVYPQNRKEGFNDYAAASKILRYFIENIGPYPYKKLANVQSKTKYGGMENASNIFYFENSVNGKGDHDGLIAHEIAHQWFGDSASELDWHHVWLSEGFATYFTNLYNEFAYGPERRAKDMAKQRNDVAAFHRKTPLPVVFAALPEDLLDILSTNSYQKGSWVLHMLRRQIGDEAFWRGIRQYYKEYQQSNAVTADLQRVMEQASGQNLANFFKQWLYTPGHPVLKASWSYNDKAKTIDVVIAQIQIGDAFNFPLEIGIGYDGSEKLIEKVEINAKTMKFSIKSSKKPLVLELDPGVNLLFEGNFTN